MYVCFVSRCKSQNVVPSLFYMYMDGTRDERTDVKKKEGEREEKKKERNQWTANPLSFSLPFVLKCTTTEKWAVDNDDDLSRSEKNGSSFYISSNTMNYRYTYTHKENPGRRKRRSEQRMCYFIH